MHLCLLLPLCLAAARADDPLKGIAPFLGDDIAVVAHTDLTRLDVEPLSRLLLGGLADEDEIAQASRSAAGWVAGLRKAGATDVFFLIGGADLAGLPSAVVPLNAGADADTIGRLLCGGGPEKPPVAWPTCATIHGSVFAGTSEALERARRPAAPRGGLAAAFAAAGDAPARVVFMPGPDVRRVLEEMLPTLPRELGGGPTSTLTRGLIWAALGLEVEPKPAFRLVVQARDAAASQALVSLGTDATRLVARLAPGRISKPDLAKDLARLRPEVADGRIVINVDADLASALIAVPVLAGQEGSHQARCTNNLKQIGLAMHNYHSAHNTFPAAYTRDKAGRPLLSWRVQILPYLEQQALFNEFHHDEPWDSPHNKALIERMPAVFACPSESRKLRKAGKTTYLAPRGKGTALPGAEAIKIGEITDGTSNTLLAVDAADVSAVSWTQPVDWEIDPEPKKDALFGHHEWGTPVLFADGSVRLVLKTIKPAVLRCLSTRSGGELISADQY